MVSFVLASMQKTSESGTLTSGSGHDLRDSRHVSGISAVDSGLLQIWHTRCLIRSFITAFSVPTGKDESPCGVRAVTHVYCTVSRSFCILYGPRRPTRHSRPFKFPSLGHHREHLPLRCYTHPRCNGRQSIRPTSLARSPIFRCR